MVLMRHGQTEWSTNGRHTGNTDIPLTAEGVAEAERMAPYLSTFEFGVVLTSPLIRARETCLLAGLEDAAVENDDLREWDYGDYEGLTSVEIHQRDPEWLLWRDGCPGGESPEMVSERCDRLVVELTNAAATGSQAAIAFAHGHILRALAARWCGRPLELGGHLELSTAAACVLGYEHDRPVIRTWNHTAGGG